MKRTIAVMLLFVVLLTCFPIVILASDMLYIDVTYEDKNQKSEGKKQFKESSILYTTQDNGDLHIKVHTYKDAEINSISIKPPKGKISPINFKKTGKDNSVEAVYKFEGPGVYKIVALAEGKLRREISIDIKQYVPATHAVRYRTDKLFVTNVDSVDLNNKKEPDYKIHLHGRDTIKYDIEEEKKSKESKKTYKTIMETLSEWVYSLNKKKVITLEKYGEPIELKGHGIVEVYEQLTNKEVIKGTYDTSSANQLKKILSEYGWSNETREHITQRNNMTLLFTPLLPGSVEINTFIEGELIKKFEDNYKINSNLFVYQYGTKDYDIYLTPKNKDGYPLDISKYELDTKNSKINIGYKIPKTDKFVIVETMPITKTMLNKKTSKELNYEKYICQVNIFLNRKIEKEPGGIFSFSASPKEKKIDGEKIVDKANLALNLKQSKTDLDKWKKYLEGKKDIKIAINIDRDVPDAKITGSAKIPAIGKEVKLSSQALLNIFEKETTLNYIDAINYSPLEEGETKEFNYTASVQVIVDGISIDLVGDPDHDYVSYRRPPEEKLYGEYHSEPEYYSEIKEGSPGNETFEAMAGVPTTRSLYFASGGSEFIVDAVFKYIKDAETTRRYRSVFDGGVDSEFKAGDTAPNQMLGDQSADLHNGGTYSKTWTGSIPNNATAVTALHSATCPAQPDRSAYDAALAEANAFAAKVNSTTLSFTSASDKQNRTYSAWGAAVSANPSDPQSTSASVSCSYRAPSGKPPSGGSPCGNEMATANPGGAGSYTITVKWAVPKHCICGPCCTHVLESIEDNWTQTIKYDYMKLEVAKIWKLDQSAVGGMVDITGSDDVVATVVQGDPSLYYNIAEDNKSRDGRIRYSLETAQDDEVVWHEGPRSNKEDGTASNGVSILNKHASQCATGILYTNPFATDKDHYNTFDYHKTKADSVDKNTMEFAKFEERRNSPNTATVISDFIILQTSSGDQSIMYFQKDSTQKKAQENFVKVSATKEEMWDNNPLSFANKMPDAINVGSYNGNYASPDTKYNNYINTDVPTKLDAFPAKDSEGKVLTRPARPTQGMRLVKTGIDIIDDIPNGEYVTGESSVFYKKLLNCGEGENKYSMDYNENYGADGCQFTSTYSPEHSKINDIVIHNPVSTQYAIILPLDDAENRDQRIEGSQVDGNLQPTEYEYERILDPNHPKQNLLYNGDCEKLDSKSLPLGWEKGEWGASGIYTHMARIVRPITGFYSLEIKSNAGEPAGSSASFYKDLTTIPMSGNYTIKGNIDAHQTTGTIELYFIDSLGRCIGGYVAASVSESASPEYFSYNFNPPAGTTKIRVELRKGITKSGTDSYLLVDNIELNNNGVNTWIPYDPVYEKVAEPNPNYVKPTPKETTFQYTGGVQEYTAPITGTYTLEVWGAQGGNSSDSKGRGTNNGGYAKGDITLTKGETIYIYVGGQGGNSPQDSIDRFDGVGGVGGWNGGGYGTGALGAGGGGATDIRYKGQGLTNRLIVGGGGGGCAIESLTIAVAGGNQAATLSNGQGESGCTSRHVSSYPNDEGGGGGGYFGGSVVHGDDTKCSYGGSSYIGELKNATMVSNQREGSGSAKITAPAVVSTTPQYITISSLAAEQPPNCEPDSWYKLNTRETKATTPIEIPELGGKTAGSFINLDYPFMVYFPNKGDFYGNGALGIGSTTTERGKGFEDGMNTTEWTGSKSVTFDFNVMYDGHTYPAGSEIELPVDEEYFEFYCVLANYEALGTPYHFKALANNSSGLDNDKMTNRVRGSNLDAKHSAVKGCTVDIVGRIGNFVIEDTGDFRFSNFFKQPNSSGEWMVKNVIKEVDITQQNKIVGSTVDIRGNKADGATNYLDTYGLLPHLNQDPVQFPVSPEKNNIKALQRQPLRLGYNVYCDIQTIGNYYKEMSIKMYYYHLNLLPVSEVEDKGLQRITPVDVYMSVNGEYKPINLFDHNTENDIKVYPFEYALNWESEKLRRNVTTTEEVLTDTGTSSTEAEKPNGDRFIFGNAQAMTLTGRNRTLIGNNATYDQIKDPDDCLNIGMFNIQGQRWHFTYGLPSSAVVVRQGASPTQYNIDELRNNNSVIIAAADIVVNGSVYSLGYKHPEGNGPIILGGRAYDTSSIYPHSILSVFSASKSSADDLEVRGTH